MKTPTTILGLGLAVAALAACQSTQPPAESAEYATTPAAAEVPATRNVALAVEGMS
ncbi:MAG: hypothetical protein ISR76_08385 [Planctomycetes bacterium]|nr:hypothetical protein [Planctomycetota bacterium]